MTAADHDVIAYTDGGCRGNPGPGSWAFMLINATTHKVLERTGGEPLTTNNRMEMLAAIEGLAALSRPGMRVLLHSDSQLMIKSVTEWIPGWKARGWRKKDGELKNVDLLKRLDEANRQHQVTWQWVRGHSGNRGNERVDLLTNEGMDRLQRGEDPAWEARTLWTP